MQLLGLSNAECDVQCLDSISITEDNALLAKNSIHDLSSSTWPMVRFKKNGTNLV